MKYKYENLEVWGLARSFLKQVYLISGKFPESERYSLTSQVNRAAVSIALNIAEGSVRQSRKEFKQFIRIAIGSLAETDTCLKISADLGYLAEEDFKKISLSIEKLFFKLIALEKSISSNGSNSSNTSNIFNNSNASNDSNDSIASNVLNDSNVFNDFNASNGVKL